MFKITREDIDGLRDIEYDNALTYGKTYASPHEAYAVLREEFEETDENMEKVLLTMEKLWLNVKEDSLFGYVSELEKLDMELTQLIMEAIQARAVVKKALKSQNTIIE